MDKHMKGKFLFQVMAFVKLIEIRNIATGT